MTACVRIEIEDLYVLRINCSESHALGIQILTNEIVADMYPPTSATISLVKI